MIGFDGVLFEMPDERPDPAYGELLFRFECEGKPYWSVGNAWQEGDKRGVYMDALEHPFFTDKQVTITHWTCVPEGATKGDA